MCVGVGRHWAGAARFAAAAVAILLAPSFVADAHAAAPQWVMYHHDAQRSGRDPDSTSPLATPTQAWQTSALDGNMNAEPLVYGSHVFVATQNDTVYSLEAATGSVAWSAHVGTAVPITSLEVEETGIPAEVCTNIPNAVGITSTPVIDPATNTLYAVTNAWNGSETSSVHHQLVALDLTTGAMRPGFPIDVDPPYPEDSKAAWHLQRPALALDGNDVIIGYGSYGDCKIYWGWVVAAPTSGVGPLKSYQVDSEEGHDSGSIWGSGNAPYVNPSGDVFVASANGNSGVTMHFDYNDSLLDLNPNLELVQFWAPENWEELDREDWDLGSSEPLPLPGGLLFQIGKRGTGLLFHESHLGGLDAKPAAELQICTLGGSEKGYGGGIYVPNGPETGTLYVTCLNGFHAVSVNTARAEMTMDTEWEPHAAEDSLVDGPPIYAGGLVWAATWNGPGKGELFGLSPSDGEIKFEQSLGEFAHFSTPSAGGGHLFVANEDKVTAFNIATPPPAEATTTTLGSSANPVPAGVPVTLTATVSPTPDAGGVTFSEAGAPIAGCAEVPVSAATGGEATCATAYAAPGAYSVTASYSGDPFYLGSPSAPLSENVTLPAAAASAGSLLAALPVAAPEISDARQAHSRWREGAARARISRHRGPRAPVGTTFSFTLSSAAAVKLTFTHGVLGHRVGRRCIAGAARQAAHRRASQCTRTVTAATLAFGGRAGRNQVAFDGRVSASRRLQPGAYSLVISASNSAGRSSAKPLRFTIVTR